MDDFLFDHERLEVYQLSRRFNCELQPVLRVLPRGAGESRDNLVRAGKSITRNIAEGGGRWAIPDKVHFYHIARASATECAAALDELVDYDLIPADMAVKPKQTLSRVVAMLINMIRSLESRTRIPDITPRARTPNTMSTAPRSSKQEQGSAKEAGTPGARK